jgi:predicted nucleotidyltransferase component of viral defense system
MDASRYEALYSFQDEALETVFEEALGFYLTGGTALSRFYLHHRYSDDLDFFSHDLHAFPDAFRLIYEKAQEKWPGTRIEVDARDFKRLRVARGGVLLKMDFVADRVLRIGLPIAFGNISVDTVRNIFSNKICAILGRDEARDIADLIWVSKERSFSWPKAFADAEKKEGFAIENFLYRLSTFPITALNEVPFAAARSIQEYAEDLKSIRGDIEALRDNSVARENAIEL